MSDDPQTTSCVWQREGDGSYQTGCGGFFMFDDGGAHANGAKYCLYCGNPIEVAGIALVKAASTETSAL
jgi:hypothetical protein